MQKGMSIILAVILVCMILGIILIDFGMALTSGERLETRIRIFILNIPESIK